MSLSLVEQTERARELREAGATMARWVCEFAFFNGGTTPMKSSIEAEALRLWPDPPPPVEVEPRVERYGGSLTDYRWANGQMEAHGVINWKEWAATPRGCTAAWLDFANDLRSWPLREKVSGRACRWEGEGSTRTLVFRP